MDMEMIPATVLPEPVRSDPSIHEPDQVEPVMVVQELVTVAQEPVTVVQEPVTVTEEPVPQLTEEPREQGRVYVHDIPSLDDILPIDVAIYPVWNLCGRRTGQSSEQRRARRSICGIQAYDRPETREQFHRRMEFAKRHRPDIYAHYHRYQVYSTINPKCGALGMIFYSFGVVIGVIVSSMILRTLSGSRGECYLASTVEFDFNCTVLNHCQCLGMCTLGRCGDIADGPCCYDNKVCRDTQASGVVYPQTCVKTTGQCQFDRLTMNVKLESETATASLRRKANAIHMSFSETWWESARIVFNRDHSFNFSMDYRCHMGGRGLRSRGLDNDENEDACILSDSVYVPSSTSTTSLQEFENGWEMCTPTNKCDCLLVKSDSYSPAASTGISVVPSLPSPTSLPRPPQMYTDVYYLRHHRKYSNVIYAFSVLVILALFGGGCLAWYLSFYLKEFNPRPYSVDPATSEVILGPLYYQIPEIHAYIADVMRPPMVTGAVPGTITRLVTFPPPFLSSPNTNIPSSSTSTALSSAAVSRVRTLVMASSSDDSDECLCCHVYKRNVSFESCGHYQYCSECAVRFDKCPTCREPIYRIHHIYA